MAIRIQLGEIVITADTDDELSRVLSLVRKPSADPARESPKPIIPKEVFVKHGPPPAPTHEAVIPADQLRQARRFLRAIAPVAGEATRAEKLVAAFGLPHAKAVGPITAQVRRTFAKIGLDPDHVYDARKINNARVWTTGVLYSRAVEEVDKRLT